MTAPVGTNEAIASTTQSFFGIGGALGPGFNAPSTSALEARQTGAGALVTLSVATPTADAHAATKAYVDQAANKPIPVSVQFNGGSTLPSNSGTEKYYIVTTAGTGGAAGATIGTILWDDGSGTGTVAIIPAAAGNSIVTTAAFTGGTITFLANQVYTWSGSAWLNTAPSVAGAIFAIRFSLALVTASSASQIPANAIITRSTLDVGTGYDSGTTISLGITGTVNLFMGTGQNVATQAGVSVVNQDTSVGSSAANVLATVSGSPTGGSAIVMVEYTVPNA